MRATCPLIVCHLAAPVSGRVVASDASLDGQGVTVAMIATDEAAEALRFSELWRFASEIQRSAGPRRQALEEAFLSHEVQKMMDQCHGTELATRLLSQRLVPAIPVLHGKLFGSGWDVVSSRPWGFVENITVLEARAALAALRFSLSHHDAVGSRILCIVDSMAVCLSMTKGRSSTNGMSTVSRRVAALALSRDAQIGWRWVPSELNPADEPSRRLDGRSIVPREASLASGGRIPGHAALRLRARERPPHSGSVGA